MARREPTNRLNNVDFPTLGRPTIAISGVSELGIWTVIFRNQLGRHKARLYAVCFSDEYYRDSMSSFSPPALKDISLYQFFSPGGVLSRTHPAYEFRRGQL